MISDAPELEPPVHVLPYATVPQAALPRAALVHTAVAFACAFWFVQSTYAGACSGYGPRHEFPVLALWILAGLAIIDTSVKLCMAIAHKTRSSPARLLALCLFGNVLCMLTPIAWDLRVRYWPH